MEAPTFCQICRHPTLVPPGHEQNCPVFTGAVQAQELAGTLGSLALQGAHKPSLSDSRPLGMGWIPLEDGYEVAKIYRDAKARLLEELKMQVEVNRRLARELIDLRAELNEARAREKEGSASGV